MSPADQPVVFVFIPPSFSPASLYHKVTARLKILNYDVYETDLKSVNNGSAPPATMYDDASNIHATIEQLADQRQKCCQGCQLVWRNSRH